MNDLVTRLTHYGIDMKNIKVAKTLKDTDVLDAFAYCIKSSDPDFEDTLRICTEKFIIKKNIGFIDDKEDWRIIFFKKKPERSGANLFSSDSIFYDSINAVLQENDIDMYKAVIEKYHCKTGLELAVGTNRIGSQLIPYFDDFAGVDLSPDMIKLASLKSRSSKVSFFCDDMVHYTSAKKYDFIYCGYNSIQMLNNADVHPFLLNIKKRLSPNGIVLIDLFNPKSEFLSTEKVTEFKCSFSSPLYGKDEIELYETHQYNEKTRQNHIWYEYINTNTNEHQKAYYSMLQLYPKEMRELFDKTGFKMIDVFGDYQLNKFNEDSNKQIYILKAGDRYEL